MKGHDMQYYISRYGFVIKLVKQWLLADPDDCTAKERLEAAVKIWKATSLPLRFIADRFEVDIRDLKEAVTQKIDEWRLVGIVSPKNDVLGDTFGRYFPELCCIRYTMQEVSNMGCWQIGNDRDYSLLYALPSRSLRIPEKKANKASKKKTDTILPPVEKVQPGAKEAAFIPELNKQRAYPFTKNLPVRNPVIRIGEII